MNTQAAAGVRELDPLRDVRHREARSARELADWLAWLELGGFAPRTLDAYERTCADLLNAFPNTAFAEFTDGDLMALLRGYPEKSRRIRKAHLGSWFKWGYRSRRIPADPMDLLPVIKTHPQSLVEVFSEAEEAALRALPSPDGHLMTLLLGAGLRKAEARHMTGKRIDLERGKIIVKEGAKGSKDRVVPAVPEVATALSNLLLLEGIGPDDFLWYDKPGGSFATRVRRNHPIAESSFARWWTRCIDQAEVPYRKPHTTRHTFATRWRERGLHVDDVQRLMGHASVSTTSDLYVHTDMDRVGERMLELL